MKRVKLDLNAALEELPCNQFDKKKILNDGLDIDYMILLRPYLADELFKELVNSVEYYDGELTKVRVFGKWHNIPRQQSAYGDSGLNYKFSGVSLPAKEWIPPLFSIKKLLQRVTGFKYNFVLVNRLQLQQIGWLPSFLKWYLCLIALFLRPRTRYRSGTDHMGEHRDDETELDPDVPIASLSLGQERTFVLKHINSRKNAKGRKNIKPVKIELEHGSLLLMNPPTNKYWYHSVPIRKNADGERLNLTFRSIIK